MIPGLLVGQEVFPSSDSESDGASPFELGRDLGKGGKVYSGESTPGDSGRIRAC